MLILAISNSFLFNFFITYFHLFFSLQFSSFLSQPITHIVYIQKEVKASNETDEKFIEEVARSTNETLQGMISRTLAYWKIKNQENSPNNALCKTVEIRKALPNSRPVQYSQWTLVHMSDIKRCKPIIQVFLYLKRSVTMQNTMILRFRRTVVGYEAQKIVVT